MTTETQTPIELAADENLRAQIEQFTNFNQPIVGGGSIKKIMADLKVSSSDLWKIDPSEIVVLSGYNPRVHNRAYYEGIASLAAGMSRDGYMQDKPLAVYIAKIDGQDRLVLQDGHRRHAAVMLARGKLGAPIKVVPVVVKDKSLNEQDLLKAMLHANEATPFTVYEKAVIAKRFKGYGWTDKQISDEMGCTTAFVGQMLKMAGAPDAIQELVNTGQLSATAALEIMEAHGEGATHVAKAAVANARAAGKTRATMKDVPTAADQKAKNAKKVAFEMYKLLVKIGKDETIVKKLDDKVLEEMDRCIGIVETVKKPKPAPAPKAPKPIKVKPAAKKAAPAAKKATAKKATGKKGSADAAWQAAVGGAAS